MLDINNLLGYQPKTPQISQVVATGGSGAGSASNNRIRRFTTLKESLGAAITYVPDAVNGDSFRINQSGMYSMSWLDVRAAGVLSIGITVNQPDLTIAAGSLTYPIKLLANDITAAQLGCITVSSYLKEGDIVRANDNAQASGTNANDVMFRITQIYRT